MPVVALPLFLIVSGSYQPLCLFIPAVPSLISPDQPTRGVLPSPADSSASLELSTNHLNALL